MKSVLINYLGLPDEPPVWVFVSGQITSTPGERIRKPWGHIANGGKRLAINNLAMGYKHEAMQILNDRLKAAVEREVARTQKEEADAKESQAKLEEANGVETPASDQNSEEAGHADETAH